MLNLGLGGRIILETGYEGAEGGLSERGTTTADSIKSGEFLGQQSDY
jgi:hypothetical protein